MSKIEPFPSPLPAFLVRWASLADVPEIARARALDPASEPGDARLAAYLEGSHSPQHALAPRAVRLASDGTSTLGYIAGHLTRRYGCNGEVQYPWVAPQYRRYGIASVLLHEIGKWFAEQHATRVCVNVADDNTIAQRFFRSCGAEDLHPHWLVWPELRGLE